MIRIVGAHWPTKLPSCLRPVRTSAADAAIAPTASPRKASDGTFAVCRSTFSVARSSYSMSCPPPSRQSGDAARPGPSPVLAAAVLSCRARPPGGPVAVRPLARVPHRVRGGRRRDAPPHGPRRVALAPHRLGRPPRPRAPLGEGGGDPLRGRRGLGHGHLLRARAALAALHGVRGADHRDALLARGLRVLRRGDLPRRVPLLLGASRPAPPPRERARRRGERRALRLLR